MLVIPVDRAVDKKRLIRKNGGTRRRKGTRGRCPSQSPFYSKQTFGDLLVLE
jgi:hypothetical protein